MSEKNTLDKTDWRKVGKGATIALAGAALTFITDLIPTIDWGEWTPLIVAVSSVLVNMGWKYLRQQKEE